MLLFADTFVSFRLTAMEQAQAASDFGDVVVLKEADGGDSGGSGCETGGGIVECDSPEGEDADGVLAGLMKFVEPGGWSAGTVLFFEHGSEEGEVGAALGGLVDLFGAVAGLSDREADRSVRPTRALRDAVDCGGAEVVGGEMDSSCAGGEGNVGAGVDQ